MSIAARRAAALIAKKLKAKKAKKIKVKAKAKAKVAKKVKAKAKAFEYWELGKSKKAKKIKVKAKAKAKVAKKVKAKTKVKKIVAAAPPVTRLKPILTTKSKAGKVGPGGKAAALAALAALTYKGTKGKKKATAKTFDPGKGNIYKALGPQYVKASMLSNVKAKRPDLYVKNPKLTEFEKEMRRIHKKYGIKANYPKG